MKLMTITALLQFLRQVSLHHSTITPNHKRALSYWLSVHVKLSCKLTENAQKFNKWSHSINEISPFTRIKVLKFKVNRLMTVGWQLYLSHPPAKNYSLWKLVKVNLLVSEYITIVWNKSDLIKLMQAGLSYWSKFTHVDR